MELLWHQLIRPAHRFLVLVLLVSLVPALAQADKGDKHYKAGRKAELHNELDAALLNYERALQTDPANARYKLAVHRLRFAAAVRHVDQGQKLRAAGKLPEAIKEFETAFGIDPSLAIAEQELRRTVSLLEAQKAGAPPVAPPKPPNPREQAETESQDRLSQVEGPVALTPPSRAPITLHATNEARMLFETIGKLAGINVLFDPDYQSRRVTIDLNNVTLEQALDHLTVLTKSLWKPLTSNTILVYSETKRRELEPHVVKTFYLSNTIQPQEITELAQTIRNLLDATKIAQVNSQNAIVMRDTPDKVAIAEKIINDIDKARPEVVIDVAVLQVRRDRARELGIFPGSPGLRVPLTFTPQGVGTTTTQAGDGTQTPTTGVTAAGVTLARLGRLSSNDWSMVLPGGALNLLLSDANTRLLQNPQVRASDGQPAKLRIGERIPVATGSFQPGIGGVGINPLVNTQFQYIDVGVNLDITPRMHAEREISMKLVVEVSSVTSRVNIGGIDQPIIGQRRVEEDIRLREGETNVLAGIVENQIESSLSGIPGLSQIPLLKYLFSSTRQTLAENEVLILLTPHIVRGQQLTVLNLKGIDVGTATNVQLRTRAEVTAPPLPAAWGGGAAPAAEGRPAAEGPRAAPTTPAAAPTLPAGPTTPGATAPAAPEPAAPTRAPEAAPETRPAPAAQTERATENAALRFDGALYNQPVGNTFPVSILIDNAVNVYSIPFQLHYDSKLLKLVNVIQGDFLARDGQAVAVVQQVDDVAGTATITLTRPPGTPGISGSGALATVTFQGVARGEATLNALATAARSAAQERIPVRGNQARLVIR